MTSEKRKQLISLLPNHLRERVKQVEDMMAESKFEMDRGAITKTDYGRFVQLMWSAVTVPVGVYDDSTESA